MALPKIEAPMFEDVFPNSKTKFSYRPFTVAEQKFLLIAQQAGGSIALLKNIITLVDVCTFNKHDIANKPVSWLEKAFLAIRAVSVSEVLDLTIKCSVETDHGICNHDNEVSIQYFTQVEYPKPLSNVINLTPTMTIKLKDVTVNDLLHWLETDTKIVDVFSDLDFFYGKVEAVFLDDQAYTEFTKDEFIDFAQTIPVQASEVINEFFNNFVQSHLNVKFKCAKCNTDTHIDLVGALNFFVSYSDMKP